MPETEAAMWDNSPSCEPELAYLIRMVLRGQTTPEQAAAALGISAEDLRTFVSACPEPQLQEVRSGR
jgi:hypothetical protein